MGPIVHPMGLTFIYSSCNQVTPLCDYIEIPAILKLSVIYLTKELLSLMNGPPCFFEKKNIIKPYIQVIKKLYRNNILY